MPKKISSDPCIANDLLDDDSDEHEVAAGEQEGGDEKTNATEREIWRKLSKNQYQARYTKFDEEENESRMDIIRKSSDMLGRRSITS